MNRWGRSLLEMMVVLGMIGLLAVITGKSFLGAATKTQEEAVRAELASELRMARQLAITRRERIQVVFESRGTGIKTEPSGTLGSTLRRFDFAGKGLVVESLSNGPSVVFYPSGRTATPTTITFRNARGERRLMTVSLTGRVNIK